MNKKEEEWFELKYKELEQRLFKVEQLLAELEEEVRAEGYREN